MKLTTSFWRVLLFLSIFFGMVYQDVWPFSMLMNWKAKQEAITKQVEPKFSKLSNSAVYAFDLGVGYTLDVDIKAGKHFWHPQVAIWLADSTGKFIKTIMVTNATAKGWFYGGRTKENFKNFDSQSADALGNYRRVNALPVWSHARGVKYADGLFVPPSNNPLPDGMSGATPSADFKLQVTLDELPSTFQVFMEMNVAFDENEYYSEYDFPDDEIYHSGTGQLGQPSVVYQATLKQTDASKFKLMKLLGHGHRSAQNGLIDEDLNSLTTALYLVDWIVVGWKKNE